MREASLRGPVLRFLKGRGYTALVDPDGHDYFDVVALRGPELGLVELKVGHAPEVFRQALHRRGWADWVAVVVPRKTQALRLLRRAGPPPTQRIGVWYLDGGSVQVLREARIFAEEERERLFPGWKDHLRECLEPLTTGSGGARIEGIRLGVPPRPPRSRRRPGGKVWRIEELLPPPEG